MFAGVILALTAPDFFHAGLSQGDEWRYVLGTLAVIGAATAVAAWTLLAFMLSIRALPAAPGGWWRYSVAELLGWMVVVAAVTSAMRAGVFKHLAAEAPRVLANPNWIELTAIAAVAAVIMTVGLRLSGWLLIAGVVVAAAAVFALAAYLLRFGMITALGAYAYVLMWVVVMQLDEPRPSREDSSGAQND